MVTMLPRDRVNGIVAMSMEVQQELMSQTTKAASKASAILSADSDVRTGQSYITVETAWADENYDHIDWFIVLNDEKSGWPGAMTIEFGRTGARGTGPSRPVAPLRKAVGLF